MNHYARMDQCGRMRPSQPNLHNPKYGCHNSMDQCGRMRPSQPNLTPNMDDTTTWISVDACAPANLTYITPNMDSTTECISVEACTLANLT